MLKKIITSIFITTSTLTFGQVSPVVKNILGGTVQVSTPVGGGTAVAIASDKNGTLFISNDHVCQLSRGKVILTGEIDFKSPLNTVPVIITKIETNHTETDYPAEVVYTTNVHLRKRARQKDLCILFSPSKDFQIQQIDSNPVEVGENVINISNAFGSFPVISSGYIGGTYFMPDYTTVYSTTVKGGGGASGSGIFNIETGKLRGIIFVMLASEEKPNQYTSGSLMIFFPGSDVANFLNEYKSKSKK
jgi:S1-C subfamily serine protease